MRSMERRLVALQETVWHTLLTLEDSAALWLATEAEAQQDGEASAEPVVRQEGESPCRVVSNASRPQERWSPPTGRR